MKERERLYTTAMADSLMVCITIILAITLLVQEREGMAFFNVL